MSKINCPAWLRGVLAKNIGEFEIGVYVGLVLGMLLMGFGIVFTVGWIL